MATKCSVSVMVRARPILFNKREEQEGTGGTCLKVNGNSTIIWDPTDNTKKRSFAFDRSFNSLTPDQADFADQKTVYTEVGVPSLEQALRGYNTTVFAYGQTGSGKTYTMMGQETVSITQNSTKIVSHEELPAEVGVIPRFCTEMFQRLSMQSKSGSGTVSHRVDSVYYEIYNDKVHDLLDSGSSRTYKVREHPKHGPYVEGLQHCEVHSYADISKLLKRGARDRHTAKTSMNDVSSRSHAVLELVLTTSRFDPQTGDLCDTSSRIALVDLAGSERQRAAGTEGERLKEGASINKGLLSLGNVIEALASNADKKNKHMRFVQYRDSTLTWLLREALGGNSRTIMIATVSPSSLNYEESLSTLKYADRAKKIQNAVSVNRDSKKQIIFALREEIKMLKKDIEDLRSGAVPLAPDDVLGRSFAGDCRVWKEEPYILQVDPLPTLHDSLLFWIEGGTTTYISSVDRTGKSIPHKEASPASLMTTADHTIKLPKSKGVEDYHALFIREKGDITLIPTGGQAYDGKAIAPTPRGDDKAPELMVDGIPVSGREKLLSGSHIQVGEFQFIFVDPLNVSDCFQFHQRCAKLERAKAAQEKMVQVTAKRVQDVLVGSGLEASLLPSLEEGLATKGRDGDQMLVRSEKGPAVYVWKGDTDSGGWVPADTMQAELAAVALVDKKKAEVECGRRLTTILGGAVNVEDLPLETDLTTAGPNDGNAGPRLVRSRDTGLKVMQWDSELKKWIVVTEPVAELTARNLADVAERKRRQEQSEAFRKEMQEKVTDLDEARRKVSDITEEFRTKEERFKHEMEGKQNREEELLKQMREKDRLLQSHKHSAAAEKGALQEKLDQVVEEYEERLGSKEHIIQSLETSYSNAKYEWHKSETLLEAALGTKQKTVDANSKLREDLSTSGQELAQAKHEMERLRERLSEQEDAVKRITKELEGEKDLRRESASEEVKQMQAMLEKKDATLQGLVEEKEQLDGNLRRLSKHYLSLQDELKEQQSRLAEYRETMEREQEQVREEMDKAMHLQKDCEQLKAEKQDLINKIKAIQNDPKKKELDSKRMQENEALKERLELLEQERKQAEGSRNYAEQTARSEKQRVADLQQRVKETTKQYQTMKEAYEREAEGLNQTKAAMAQQKEELASLKGQLHQIKQQPGFMTGAEQGRRDLDLSIQLEMVREENQRLQQKLADERMLRERSTDSGRQLAKEKMEVEDSLKKMKKEFKDVNSQLTAMTSRADRLKEMSQKLQSEALKKSKQDSDDPPMSGRRTQPYGPSHGFTTPRKSTGPSTGRKRSVSNEIKVPSYAKPTGAWMARDDDTPALASTGGAESFANSGKHQLGGSTKMRGHSPSAKGQTPRKGRNAKTSKVRQPSPTPQCVSPTNPALAATSPSPRGSRSMKPAAEGSGRSSSASALKTEEF
eukprot:TRINITY_DN43256_c0_g1_i1.p1 TRINITY_DN43256_c0_g1~~TRINITY_DN43256_c0_g1_i1.p1  ORF type:complete len:1417 (+),score=638.11 TRINITY_DN43256_c0_g1_i1:57-4307(+)